MKINVDVSDIPTYNTPSDRPHGPATTLQTNNTSTLTI
jgi:hypothetical protein